MPVQAITDPRVRLRPTKSVIQLLAKHKDSLQNVPLNVAEILEKYDCTLPAAVINQNGGVSNIKHTKIDVSLIEKLDVAYNESDEHKPASEQNAPQTEQSEGDCYLYLTDLHWLNDLLKELRRQELTDVFLYQLLKRCELVLPANEVTPRNPALEERCEQLRNEQFNRKYMQMTKGVDPVYRRRPEDSFGYQIKAINKQIAIVVQVLFSIVAGFVFGFWGLSYLNGGLEFGKRLMIGIGCALIIAIAELYILIKKLSEYDDAVDVADNQPNAATIELKTVANKQRRKQEASNKKLD